MIPLRRLARPDGNAVAYRSRPGRGPAILFLPGYMSDMEGGKATALDCWCEAQGRAMIRLDYRGCGSSDGRFEDFGLADWLEDVLAVIDEVAEGPLVLVGSSMGGWLMLLAALEQPERMAALVGVAPAPDFTSWGFTHDQKQAIREEGRLVETSPYGEQPYVTTRRFWDSGEGLLLLGGELAIDCPVRLLHGQADEDVPWGISLKIADRLRSPDVHVSLIKDGEHRLSRPQDIGLLIATVEQLVKAP
jgi:pimeloyl-ACP methyl ester carboxylesterase